MPENKREYYFNPARIIPLAAGCRFKSGHRLESKGEAWTSRTFNLSDPGAASSRAFCWIHNRNYYNCDYESNRTHKHPGVFHYNARSFLVEKHLEGLAAFVFLI